MKSKKISINKKLKEKLKEKTTDELLELIIFTLENTDKTEATLLKTCVKNVKLI